MNLARKQRSDKGVSRIDLAVQREVERVLSECKDALWLIHVDAVNAEDRDGRDEWTSRWVYWHWEYIDFHHSEVALKLARSTRRINKQKGASD